MDPFTITVNIKRSGYATAKLKRGEKKISSVDFIYEKTFISITDLLTGRRYRRKGYATLLMYFMMGLSKSKRRPLYLYSLNETVKFYEKLGFVRLRRYKNGRYKGKRVIIDNLNPHKTFNEQTNRQDLIWIPTNMHIAHICV